MPLEPPFTEPQSALPQSRSTVARSPCPRELTQRVFSYVTYHSLVLQRFKVCNFGHIRPWPSGNLHRHGLLLSPPPPPSSSSSPVNQNNRVTHSPRPWCTSFYSLLVRFQVRVVLRRSGLRGADLWELSMLTSWWFSLCYTHRILDFSTSCL